MCGKNPLWEHHKHFLAHTALRRAHNPNQVSTATGAPSLPTVWVSPDPCTPLGVSSTSSFGLWVLDSPSRVWLHCLAFPAVPLGTPKSLSLWQSMDVISGEMPGAQLQFSSSWSLHTGQQYHSSRGCSGSWGPLYGSSKVILEKHLKLDLGVLIGAIFSTTSVLQIIIPEMTNFKHNKLFI